MRPPTSVSQVDRSFTARSAPSMSQHALRKRSPGKPRAVGVRVPGSPAAVRKTQRPARSRALRSLCRPPRSLQLEALRQRGSPQVPCTSAWAAGYAGSQWLSGAGLPFSTLYPCPTPIATQQGAPGHDRVSRALLPREPPPAPPPPPPTPQR